MPGEYNKYWVHQAVCLTKWHALLLLMSDVSKLVAHTNTKMMFLGDVS